MEDSTLRVVKAMHFAAVRHAHQRRKGELAEPYFNHVSEVARTLAEHVGCEDADLLIAGLLHDTIEDTDTTREELADAFGDDVAGLVAEVSDDKRLPKEERKRRQVETAPAKSPRARMIKIADKICNLRAILESPPRNWSAERKRDYFAWAKRVVDGCRGVNAPLEARFDEIHAEGMRAFSAPGGDPPHAD